MVTNTTKSKMNQKAYSVLFCALLASTFVHELKAKGVAPVSSRKLDVFGSRAASAEVCYLECHLSSNSTTSFGITIEVIGNVLVIANLSASAALLLDITTQIVVVLNGTTGAGVAIDLEAQSGVYISGGLWVGGKASLETLIQVTLGGSLKALWNIKGAVTFTVQTISSAILTVINEVVVWLVIGISAQIVRDARLGLQIILSIAGQLTVLLNGPLSGALKLLIVSGTIAVAFDLAGLVVALRTLSIIISAAGGIEALISAGVVLDLALILGASSGLHAFANLLLQLSESSQALTALKAILENGVQVLVLIGGLGGGVLIGITGAFVIIGKIGLLVSRNVTLEQVISSVITYVATSSVRVTSDLTESLNIGLEGLITVIERINVSGNLSGLLTIITSLRDGSLIIGGINVAKILIRLVGVYVGVSALLAVVAAVALELTVVSQAVAISTLLLVLISKLSIGVGIRELIQLGIRIQVNILTTFASIIAASITLIPSLAFGGVYEVLLRLSTIGVIVSALNSALIAIRCGLTLRTIVSQSKSLILGFFQGITKISLHQSAEIQAEALKILNATGSISGYLSGGLNVTWSGSASGNITISG